MTFRRIRVVLGALMLASPLVVLAAAPASNAQTPSTVAPTPQEKAAAIVSPSIVYLSIDAQYYLDTGYTGAGYIGPYELKGSCTGSFVNSDGYVLTAGHCVDLTPGSTLWDAAIKNGLQSEVNAGTITADEANSILNEALTGWKVEGKAAGSSAQLTVTVVQPLGVSGQQASGGKTARVVEAKSIEDGDTALIKIEQTNAPIIQLGSDSDVSIGTPVLAVGYPGAEDGLVDPTLSPTFKDGQINTKGTREGIRVPVYEMSAALSPGMSGGPTAGLDGKLIGVNSFMSLENQQFNFISPVSLASELLSRNNVKNELGPVDTDYREGLDAYYAGDYQAAIASFDKVLGIAPGHYYAQQFKQKSNEKLASAPATTTTAAGKSSSSGGSSAALFVVLGIVVLLVLVVIVLIVVMKGRGNKGGPTPQAQPAPGYGTTPPPGAPPGAVPPQPTVPTAPAPTAPVATLPPPTAAPTAPPGTAPMTPTVPDADAGPAPAGTAFCSSCGRQVSEGERFCPSCGHDLQA